MVLTRNLNYDAKVFSTLKVKHKKGKETNEEALIRFRKETISKANAQQQIAAFLSFKEAICTGTRNLHRILLSPATLSLTTSLLH
jgi:hypothetical protein